MQGLMGQETHKAEAQRSNVPGHPVVLPSTCLWMAVLVGVLRGLKSVRAIWRLLVTQGYEIGDQAVYNRLDLWHAQPADGYPCLWLSHSKNSLLHLL